MREIKFRAWCLEGFMFYPSIQELSELGVTTLILGEEIDSWTGRIILMASTGLRDRNGVEIYEGDIVAMEWDYLELDKGVGSVVRFGSYHYNSNYSMNDPYDLSRGYGFYIDSIHGEAKLSLDELLSNTVVIGNIHENPELAKNEKKFK